MIRERATVIRRVVVAERDTVHGERAVVEDAGTLSRGAPVSDRHASNTHGRAAQNLEDAVDAVGVDNGRTGPGTRDRQIRGNIQITGLRRTLARPSADREVIRTGSQVNRVVRACAVCTDDGFAQAQIGCRDITVILVNRDADVKRRQQSAIFQLFKGREEPLAVA